METNEHARPGAREIQVVATPEELAYVAAETVVLRAADAIRDHGRFIVALSGGSTPDSLFHLLATSAFASRIDWQHVHVCWGDERCISPRDARSNYRMACDAFLERVPIPTAHVHRMRGEDAPQAAAAAYEAELRELFNVHAPHDDDFPAFDLILLGLGADGHTASLFPDGTALREQRRWVVADYAKSVSMWRITLTLPLINASHHVLFLVAGADKAEVVQQIFIAPTHTVLLPAARVAPTRGVVRWILDSAAAATTPGSRITSA